ncbi:MAG TPA: DUF4203 domain-containing protein [Gaiellaceae bacterium]|nr:DUF4203 domain-containing protein [Gaiellaceae bacterium]
MEDVIFALLVILAGGLFCFFGYLAFRVIIPIWGAVVGFSLGAGLIAAATDEGFLRTGLAWIVAIGLAVLFALLAYLFYWVAVVLAMGSIGFALGTAVMGALGVDWSWVVVLVGVLAGTALALLAIVADLPMILLVLLSALAGASAVTAGLMVLTGAIETEEFTDEAVTAQAADDWWWYLVYGVLAAAGIVYQLQAMAQVRGSMRDDWEARRA